MKLRPILLVDDSPEDREMALRAFRIANVTNPIYCCEDGDDALDFLKRRGPYADRDRAPRPGLIILDLNMPGTDGREVLACVKRDERLRAIPIVVLSTSTNEQDVDRCYEAGANSYIRKSIDFNCFTESVRRIKNFWVDTVVLPAGERRENAR